VLDLGPLVRPVILGGMQPARVPVDRQRDLRDVAIIDAEGLDALTPCPLREVLESLGKPAAEVTDLVGNGSGARPAGRDAGEGRCVGVRERDVSEGPCVGVSERDAGCDDGAGTVGVSSPGSFAVRSLGAAFLLRAKSPRLVELRPIPAGVGDGFSRDRGSRDRGSGGGGSWSWDGGGGSGFLPRGKVWMVGRVSPFLGA
jgi:hypothetical protein